MKKNLENMASITGIFVVWFGKMVVKVKPSEISGENLGVVKGEGLRVFIYGGRLTDFNSLLGPFNFFSLKLLTAAMSGGGFRFISSSKLGQR